MTMPSQPITAGSTWLRTMTIEKKVKNTTMPTSAPTATLELMM